MTTNATLTLSAFAAVIAIGALVLADHFYRARPAVTPPHVVTLQECVASFGPESAEVAPRLCQSFKNWHGFYPTKPE